MTPPLSFPALGAMLLAIGAAPLPAEFDFVIQGAGHENQSGESAVRLQPSAVWRNPAEATAPAVLDLFRPIHLLEFGQWFGAPDGLLGGTGASVLASGGRPASGPLSPLLSPIALGSGLDFGTLRISAPLENADRPAVTLSGDLGLFSASAQQPGTTDLGDNPGLLRGTPAGPSGERMGAVWALPLVFLLVFWLLRGLEKGKRRRRSSSHRTPAPVTSPRRTSRRRHR